MKSSMKLAALLTTSFLALCCVSAQAQEWTGDAGDNLWQTGGNWQGGVAPLNTGDVGFFYNTTASITLPGSATSIGAVDINHSNLELVGQATSFTVEDFYVYNGSTATLNLPSSSQFTVTADASFIGDSEFGTGTLSVMGAGTLSFTDNGNTLYVGGGNSGGINQTGATVAITGVLTVGSDGDFYSQNAPGTGFYTLSGTSTLTAGSLYLGASAAAGSAASTGTFSMTSGVVTVTDTLALGVNITDPTTAVTGDSGVFQQSGGVVNAGTVEVGESTGGFGTYTLGSGTFVAGNLVIGDNTGATGTFTQLGGTGTVTTFAVGESGTGNYSLSSGTMTVLTGGSAAVGDQTGSHGSVTVTSGLLDIQGTSALTVGNNGAGSFSQQGGTVNVGGALAVGVGTGTGSYALSGGTLNANGGIFVGGGGGTGTFSYTGGTLNTTGDINIASGSTFNQGTNFAPSTGSPVVLASGAIYNLNAGTLTIGGNITDAVGFNGISADPNAIFNFAGGNVTTSSAWTDSLVGAVSGNSTIDTTLGNATLSGALTGGGSLTVTGGGTLDITGVNSSSASWGIDARVGTITADASTFPSSGSMVTESSGTIELGDTNTHALSGSVSGNGNFNVNFGSATSTLELAGPVNFTPGVNAVTTLTGGGTLQVLDGTFQTIGSNGNLLIGNGTSGGTVNIDGTAGYDGTTTVEANSTLLAHDITSTALLTNHGTIGANAATFNIGGSFISDGTIQINMNNAPSTDVYAVTGTANVSGSGFTILNQAAVTGTFTFLTSTGLTANNLKQPTSNLFTHATVAVDGGNPDDLDLVLTTTTSSGIAGLTLTPNQSAVAAPLDSLILSGSTQPNFSRLLNLIGGSGTSASQLALNYEQLTPESLQYAQDIAYEHSAFLVSKIDGFDDALHHEFAGFDTNGVTIVLPGFNSGLGRQMQSMLAYNPPGFHTSAPNGVNYYPGDDSGPAPASPEPGQVMSDSPTTAPMPMHTSPHVTIRKPYSNFSAFIGGDGTIADLNQDSGASYAPSTKASYTSVDAVGGISYRMTSNLAAGVLFDYSHTDADTDDYGSKTKVDSYSPGVFATYGDKGFYINGLFSYGRNNYSNDRAIPVVGGVANSSPDGNQYTAALDAGQELHLGDAWTITPSGGLTYTHLDIDGFTETGAEPADLNVQAQHDDSLRSRLGGSLGYVANIGRITFLPTFTAMWQHEFMDENAPITSSFNDFSSGSFTIHSVSQGRDSALIGVGVTAQLDNSMAIFFECNADVNGNYQAENLVGGFKGSF